MQEELQTRQTVYEPEGTPSWWYHRSQAKKGKSDCYNVGIVLNPAVRKQPEIAGTASDF